MSLSGIFVKPDPASAFIKLEQQGQWCSVVVLSIFSI
jgi:hypothetical protein